MIQLDLPIRSRIFLSGVGFFCPVLLGIRLRLYPKACDSLRLRLRDPAG